MTAGIALASLTDDQRRALCPAGQIAYADREQAQQMGEKAYLCGECHYWRVTPSYDQVRAVAFHEAGHAESAVAFGWQVTECWIDQHGFGYTGVRGPAVPELQMIHTAAGLVAEYIATERDGVLDQLQEGVSFHREEWQACGGGLDHYVEDISDGGDAALLMRLIELYPQSEALERICGSADMMLTAIWPDVESRAAELIAGVRC